MGNKLARVVEVYAKRLQIQEKMTAQIANSIQLYVGVLPRQSADSSGIPQHGGLRLCHVRGLSWSIARAPFTAHMSQYQCLRTLVSQIGSEITYTWPMRQCLPGNFSPDRTRRPSVPGEDRHHIIPAADFQRDRRPFHHCEGRRRASGVPHRRATSRGCASPALLRREGSRQ